MVGCSGRQPRGRRSWGIRSAQVVANTALLNGDEGRTPRAPTLDEEDILRSGVINDPISALGLLISVFAWGFVAFSPRLIEPSRGNDDEDFRSHTFIMGRTADGMRGPD